MCRYTKAPETQTALVLNSGGKGKANFSLLPSTYYVRVLVLPARLASDSRHHFFEEGNRFLLIHSSVVGGSHRVRIRTPIIAEYAPYIIDFQLCTYLVGKDGKIDMKNLDLTRMEKMEMKDIGGTAYTLIAYSKALRCKVRLVIWQMPNGKKKLFFSTDTSLSGEEVLLYYRTRFQIEFCFRDAKGYTGLMDCQTRDKWKLDFAFNASFTSLNVAKVTMKGMGMEYSMSSFKSLMTNIYLVKRIFKASGYTPNRTLISKIFKDLSCLQRIAA